MDRETLIAIKENEYRKYIDTHIWAVKECYEIFVEKTRPLNLFSFETLENLKKNILIHDQSKYSTEEFYAYRKWFYPIDEEEKESAKEEFRVACHHHYKFNKHHPENWLNPDGVPSVMNIVFVAEMIIDWMAVSFVNNGNVYEWYKDNQQQERFSKILNPLTRTIVDNIIECFKKSE